MLKRVATFARHIPNLLTASRLVFTPLIAHQVLNGRFWAAIAIFIISGITDAVDGPIARKLGVVSRFGVFLDPVADKLFVAVIYLCLAWIRQVPWWLIAIVFARDMLILAVAAGVLLFSTVREFRPSAWGKAATTTHVVTIVTVMVREATGAEWVRILGELFIIAAAAITAWSGIHYGWRAGWRLFRNEASGEQKSRD